MHSAALGFLECHRTPPKIISIACIFPVDLCSHWAHNSTIETGDMQMFSFTENEARAVKALYASCLNAMGGKTFADLESDPHTWVDVADLVKAGWTRPEAIGTLGSLIVKGAVDQYDESEWVLKMDAAKWASEH
jgi:hypothetical protein